MSQIINGPNGKYVLATLSVIAVCATPIILYSMKLGYMPSLNAGEVQLTFCKA